MAFLNESHKYLAEEVYFSVSGTTSTPVILALPQIISSITVAESFSINEGSQSFFVAESQQQQNSCS